MPLNLSYKPISGSQASFGRRDKHLKAALNFFSSASECAEAGDLRSAGSLILKALEQERKAGSVGPQVLQVIKPQS